MLALDLYRQSRCRGCGGDLHETTEPGNEGRYEALPPVQCHRCVAYDISVTAYQDQPHPGSLLHQVRLRGR